MLKKIAQILVAITFIISAILKLNSIDSFEVYIYSFGIFSLNLSFLIARILISIELFLGAIILIGLYAREAIISALVMMLLFTIFILSLLFGDSKEHCHCFGDALVMSHTVAILKNIIIIALLFVSLPKLSIKRKFEKIAFAILFIVSISIPMIVSPPDSFRMQYYAAKTTYNAEYLDEYIKSNNLSQGKRIISFYGASCRFCKLAAKKMDVIGSESKNPEIFTCVFWGSESKIQSFFDITNTTVIPYKTIEVGEFLKITDGSMPLIVLIDNGKVVDKFGYRSIVESDILDFSNSL